MTIGPILLVERFQQRLQANVAVWIVKVHGVIVHSLQKVAQIGITRFDAAAFDDSIAHVVNELVLQWTPGDANDGKLCRQQAGLFQVIERRQQFPLGQVARGAKDDNNTWLRHPLGNMGRLQFFRRNCYFRRDHLALSLPVNGLSYGCQ